MKIIGKPRSKCRNTALSKNVDSILYPSQSRAREQDDKAQNMGWQVEC